MKFSIAIELGREGSAFGLVVPDLPGCFSAGDTLEEAIGNAHEAICLWLASLIDNGGAIPQPRPIAEHMRRKEFKHWVWMVVDVDLAELSDKVERINITLPSRVLRRIDRDARAAGETRSGYIARKMLIA